MIPRSWTICKLQAVAEIQTGIAKGKRGIEDPIELPYLRVANVQDGHLDLSEIKTITVSKRQVERYLLRNGDVLLTEGGDYDKLGRGTIWHNQVQPCLHQNHIFVIRTNLSLLLPEFFGYQASSSYGKRYFLSCAKQTTNLASINSTQLKEFPVLVPSLVEQKKIAEILATWDKAIAIIEKAIVAKQKRRKALTNQVLSSQLRSDHSSQEKWRTERLENIAKTYSGGTPSRSNPEYFQGDIPWIKSGEINKEVIDSTEENISQKALLESSARMVGAGTVLIAMYGATAGKVAISRIDAAINQAILAIVSLEIDRDFLYYFLKREMHQVVRKVQGGQPNLNAQIIKETKISLPSIEKQRLIGQFLRTLDAEIRYLGRVKSLYQQQKRGLMQKLLTGEWRVSVEQAA